MKNLHAVDVVSIGTKSDPIPMKELDDERRIMGYEGKYCGHNPIISTLKKDTFEFRIAGRHISTSRWAMCRVQQELRNQATCAEHDQVAQFYKKHCATTITSGAREEVVRTIPSEELMVTEDEHIPVIGVRVYFGGASAVLVNLAYFYHYGYHRCNLAQDSELKEGVY